MLRVAFISAIAASAYGALELTPETWETEVKESGKAAFIKFLAPW